MENEWWDIEGVFIAVIAIVEEAQAAALKPLKDRREVVEKDAEYIREKLEKEIRELEKAVSELDDISALEDHILFLQVRGMDLVCVIQWGHLFTCLMRSYNYSPAMWLVWFDLILCMSVGKSQHSSSSFVSELPISSRLGLQRLDEGRA